MRLFLKLMCALLCIINIITAFSCSSKVEEIYLLKSLRNMHEHPIVIASDTLNQSFDKEYMNTLSRYHVISKTDFKKFKKRIKKIKSSATPESPGTSHTVTIYENYKPVYQIKLKPNDYYFLLWGQIYYLDRYPKLQDELLNQCQFVNQFYHLNFEIQEK